MDIKGDDFLSSHLKKLWALHRDIIYKWGVYTIFKWERWGHSTTKERLFTHWFVPKHASQCFEIIKWLEYELKDEKFEPDDGLPGTDVSIQVFEYDGLDPYIEQDEIEKTLVRC